jgi:hypothetical protein
MPSAPWLPGKPLFGRLNLAHHFALPSVHLFTSWLQMTDYIELCSQLSAA